MEYQKQKTPIILNLISNAEDYLEEKFQIIEQKKIGSGSFGIVKLARHRNTCRMYAIKINLKNAESEIQLKLFEREIKLHSELDHPHLIKLWDTILQNGNIFMIMEYAENGNLFYYQNSKMVFTEPEAFKFFTQTLQGIAYLHSNDIIHRDLKPENLLLDNYSNIKICDFGWAAQDIKAKRSTFCGTYEYMAPEMLFKKDYDYRIDIWALGVLLYQMLHGYAPFKGKTITQIQEAMLKGTFDISPTLSQPVRDLIGKILQISPGKRLQIDQIFKHPWVKEMEHYLNNYFNSEKVQLPIDLQSKISTIPPILSLIKLKLTDPKHRKNISMNIEDSAFRSINLQGNNLPFAKKKLRNHFHSQQKSIQGAYEDNKDCIKFSHQINESRVKLQGISKDHHRREFDMHKMIEKMKKNKSSKNTRQLPSFEKETMDSGTLPLKEVANKKKQTITKSQVEMLAEKYPIRFNTQAYEKQDWQPCKLKKGHLKSKILNYSKSALRILKGKNQDRN